MNLSITWLGHATFLVVSPGGKRIVFDPWMTGNPASPDSAKKLGALDLILITHGHNDHTGDAVPLARSSGAHTVAPFELAEWLGKKGLKSVTGMNPGGTLRALGLSITMVPAVHSSSVDDDGQTIHPMEEATLSIDIHAKSGNNLDTLRNVSKELATSPPKQDGQD